MLGNDSDYRCCEITIQPNMGLKTQSFQDESGQTWHRLMSVLTFNLRGWGQEAYCELANTLSTALNFISLAFSM